MSLPEVNIAITGLNNIDSPGPGIPIIRALRDSDRFHVRVIGLAYENLEPGIYLDGMCDKTYMVPYPSSGVEALLNRLEYIHKKEHIDVLIPNFDAELYAFIKAENWLKERGINTWLPQLKQLEERAKNNLPEFGKKYGFNVPKSYALSGLHQLKTIQEKLSFPFFVKGKFYDAYLCWNPNEAQQFFLKVQAKWGLPIIVQERIQGTEVNVVALGNGQGGTIGAVPMRKTYITDKGKAWGGITLADDKMLELTHNLIQKTNWRSGMELELIRTPKNEYYIIEINPRLPAWVYLAVGAGQNIPEAMVRLALGEQVDPLPPYQVGKMFIRYSYDLIGDLSKFEQIAIKGEI